MYFVCQVFILVATRRRYTNSLRALTPPWWKNTAQHAEQHHRMFKKNVLQWTNRCRTVRLDRIPASPRWAAGQGHQHQSGVLFCSCWLKDVSFQPPLLYLFKSQFGFRYNSLTQNSSRPIIFLSCRTVSHMSCRYFPGLAFYVAPR